MYATRSPWNMCPCGLWRQRDTLNHIKLSSFWLGLRLVLDSCGYLMYVCMTAKLRTMRTTTQFKLTVVARKFNIGLWVEHSEWNGKLSK